MYLVSPSDPETFYLRLLLLHVPGAKCFDDLKMMGHTIAVCIQKHLTDDSEYWVSCISPNSEQAT